MKKPKRRSIIIDADDLAIGQVVTIHTGRRSFCECGCGTPVGDESYVRLKGLPLQVVALILPYVSVILGGQHRAVIDVRQCNLCRLSDDYIKSLTDKEVADV